MLVLLIWFASAGLTELFMRTQNWLTLNVRKYLLLVCSH